MRSLPLEGIRVADFSWVLAGPSVGRVLADYGATVVRVETAERVDLARALSPFTNGQIRSDNSALASDVNAGKLGLALDLAVPEARDVARKLADWADIVIESFSPGTMKKWGLDFEALTATNPDLIMLSTCLMGNAGPLAKMAGFGSAGSCLSGIHYVTGWPDLFPTGYSGPYTDFTAPRFSLIGLLAALDRRRRTGQGAYIDVSQVETGLQFMSLELLAYATTGAVAERAANADPHCCPNNAYRCAPAGDGSDRFVAISVRNDADWRALLSSLDLAGLGDLADASLEERRAHSQRIDDAIQEATSTQAAEAVEARLQQAGVPAHVAVTGVDLVRDPQLIAREHFVPVRHPRRGPSYVESTRIRLSETPGRPQGAGPDIGEHEHFVLGQLLGLSADQIEQLAQSGALR
ncbi:CoA transferase [Alsobacter sp. SYSU M60028]|uniref:CoA transferase n=1 Tax=Alsobacter ponti TaxID=2962936 RepID=A0ABT1LER7_9HYPH|nr:CoA transferase [Alsobacter ponti]MCP8939992.1 CoA transferase [Alsobacter ponti]